MSQFLLHLIYIVVGLVETFIATMGFKFLQRNMIIPVFITDWIYNFLMCYVLVTLVKDTQNVWLIVSYSTGYALGGVFGIIFDKYLAKLAKSKGLKRWKRKFLKRIKR